VIGTDFGMVALHTGHECCLQHQHAPVSKPDSLTCLALHLPTPSPQVHTGMAEQAFRSQVQSVLGDGVLTPDRAAALEKMREQVGRRAAACLLLPAVRVSS
jgi:hypothetical protein